MVIRSFKCKKLKKFFETGSKATISPSFSRKLELILDRLAAAQEPNDMNFPGSDFHPLKGDLRGFYSVHVNGNWVVIFRFQDGEFVDIDLIDYH